MAVPPVRLRKIAQLNMDEHLEWTGRSYRGHKHRHFTNCDIFKKAFSMALAPNSTTENPIARTSLHLITIKLSKVFCGRSGTPPEIS
jgi:hypothetical protein